jgi:hypothetical protein
MKTNIYKVVLVTILTGAGAFTSCIFDLSESGGRATGVNFSAGIEDPSKPLSRTTDGGNTWVEGDGVGIFMIQNGGSLPGEVIDKMANKRYNVTNVVTGELQPDNSTYPVINYPQTGIEVDFVAYYPFSDDPTKISANGIYSVDLTDQSDPAKLDVMVAKKAGFFRGPVGFHFRHALSKITINIKPAEGENSVPNAQVAAINKVNLMATPGSVKIDINTGGTTDGPNAPLHLFKSETPSSGYDATFTAIMAPTQGFTGGRYVAMKVNRNVVVWSIPEGDTFLPGKNYIYWGSVSDSDFNVEESRIETWIQNDLGQIEETNHARTQQNNRITWNGSKYVLTTDPKNGGLYFKFGSVVGIYTDHGAVASLPTTGTGFDTFEAANDIAWTPTGNLTGNAEEGWAKIPCYTPDDFTLSPNTVTPDAYHNIPNVKAGKGDPCRLVELDLDKIKKTDASKLTTEDIDNGKWRLPTVDENKAFAGREVTATYSAHWTTLNEVPGGMFPNTTLGDITTYLPAVGRRATNTGKIASKTLGVYWASMPSNATWGYELHFESQSIQPLRTGMIDDGFTVRCVRQ